MSLVSAVRAYQYTCDRAKCPHYINIELPIDSKELPGSALEAQGWTVSHGKTYCDGEH